MKKEQAGCILGIAVLFITMPIGFYLQYSILKMVHATELMWFLFWFNIPVSFLIAGLARIAENLLKD